MRPRARDGATAAGTALRLRAEVLRTRGALLLRVGRVHEAVEAYAEAIAVFRQGGARRPEARAKNSLAYAMFVLGRFEDAIALALEAIRIDLSIGGRFQIAKTLSNIGQCYCAARRHAERAKSYLKRARDAHERYGDQDGRADTLLASAEIFLETGEYELAEALIADAAALSAATGNAYDSNTSEAAQGQDQLPVGACVAAGPLSALEAQRPAAPATRPEIDIPFQKFVLKNGLTLIVHEDHKAPIVAVNVWYHVGSKNEKPGRTGFAHLFEHLMFNGSENYNDDYFKAARAGRRHRPERHDQRGPHQLLPERAHHRARPGALAGVRPHGPPARRDRPRRSSTSSAAWCRTRSARARTSPTARSGSSSPQAAIRPTIPTPGPSSARWRTSTPRSWTT